MFKKVASFLSSVRLECSKIVWGGREKVLSSVHFLLCVMIFGGFFVYVLDLGLRVLLFGCMKSLAGLCAWWSS